MAKVAKSGSRTGRGSAPQVYEGTTSGYGPTRADSVGQPVPAYAYSAAQQSKAYNKMRSMKHNLTKILEDDNG